MTITRKQLYLALMRREPWHPRAADWRKLPNGRIFRFVNWNWKQGGRLRAPESPRGGRFRDTKTAKLFATIIMK